MNPLNEGPLSPRELSAICGVRMSSGRMALGLPPSCPRGEAQGHGELGLTLALGLTQMTLGRIKGFFTASLWKGCPSWDWL